MLSPSGLSREWVLTIFGQLSRALSVWNKAKPGVTYDLQLFRRFILLRLATVKLSEIAGAADCCKASAVTSGAGSGRRMCRRGGIGGTGRRQSHDSVR